MGFEERWAEEVARAADPQAARLHLERFLEAVPSSSNLLAFLQDHPFALEVLCRILGASPYLTQLLVRSPEYFYWLLEGERLEAIPGEDYFQRQARELTGRTPGPEKALDALRRLRRRENLRIAAQDLLKLASLQATVRQISHLAEALLEAVFQILAQELLPFPAGFAVLALGKLGGEELNFSSDIDLLYVYAEPDDRDRMLRFARRYTRVLTQYSDQGRLYRVDLRLRPMGKSGDIASSLEACRHYYETWADTYDRLALIKCRCVAGDRRLGHRFVAAIQDFVFKKYLDTAAIEEIRWLKRRMDRLLRRRSEGDRNIKLGSGGIREIEFFVQAFQLLYGGRHPEIRNPGTLAALDGLVDHGFIPPEDYQTLRRAYLFLRDLEHKLQLVHDQQTHLLPADQEELARCARRMGYGKNGKERALEGFLEELNRHTSAVRKIFDALFETGPGGSGVEELFLNPELGREEALDLLGGSGLNQAEEVYDAIQILAQAPSFPHSPSRARNLLANLAPHLIEACSQVGKPRLLVSRFDRFCESLGARANLYAEIVENPAFGRKLFAILASGDFLAETLIRNPELLDSISKGPGEGIDLQALQETLDREEAGGGDVRTALRILKQREEFKVALLDLLGESADPAQTRRRLSELAGICVAAACRRVLDRMPALRPERWALFALGKLGGSELTYHSDLDLLLVYDDSGKPPSARRFAGLLKELREELESYTQAGRAYRLDFRLRPEGKHGPLAVPRRALESYFKSRAEPWERMAYVKIRPLILNGPDLWDDAWVFGRPFTAEEVVQLRRIRLRKEREIGREQAGGHFDFKVGRGGLMDVQFVVQYLQIQYGVRATNTRQALARLIEQGHLDAPTGEALGAGLDFLFSLEAMQRLLEERPASSFSRHPGEASLLARYLGYPAGSALLDHYAAHTEAIRKIYQRAL